MRRYLGITGAVIGLIVLTAVPAAAARQAEPPPHRVGVTLVRASFQNYTPATSAVTYDPRLVPVGATASVLGVSGPGGTIVTLVPKGLVPNRQYGAHVHTKSCGRAPADAGPHYQNVVDPRQPSTDPAFANNKNEIWLDFATDARGNAFAITKVDWAFTDRHAHSVVIHEHHTHTGDGDAGTAGARLACIKANF